jgi:hypothetical protein
MLTAIVWLIFLLIVLVLVLYAIDLVPLPGDPRLKSIIKALVVLAFIVVLLRMLGVFGGSPYLRF